MDVLGEVYVYLSLAIGVIGGAFVGNEVRKDVETGRAPMSAPASLALSGLAALAAACIISILWSAALFFVLLGQGIRMVGEAWERRYRD